MLSADREHMTSAYYSLQQFISNSKEQGRETHLLLTEAVFDLGRLNGET